MCTIQLQIPTSLILPWSMSMPMPTNISPARIPLVSNTEISKLETLITNSKTKTGRIIFTPGLHLRLHNSNQYGSFEIKPTIAFSF